MDGVYDVLNWMLDDNLFTHQIPRATRQCGPRLIEAFPELATASTCESLAKLDELTKNTSSREAAQRACKRWIAWLQVANGLHTEYEVPQISTADQCHQDPLAELSRMTNKPVVVVST
jgi:predicted RNase H-like nuclease